MANDAARIVVAYDYHLYYSLHEAPVVSNDGYDDTNESPADLPTASYAISYTRRRNTRPSFTRKETVVDMLHPEYGFFADLTRQEEELGLLSQPDIASGKHGRIFSLRGGSQLSGHRSR